MVVMGRTAHLGLFAGPRRPTGAMRCAALEALGIADLAETEYTRISGGQRQLALVARALAQDAPAIVMDEPTASLDFGNQVVVLSEVKRLAARGLAVVLSTHDPDHAFSIGDRVALMDEGTLVAQGAPVDVLTPARLRAVYGVKVAVERLPQGQTVCAPDYEFRLTARLTCARLPADGARQDGGPSPVEEPGHAAAVAPVGLAVGGREPRLLGQHHQDVDGHHGRAQHIGRPAVGGQRKAAIDNDQHRVLRIAGPAIDPAA